MRVDLVKLNQKTAVGEMLRYYMGKNTQQRQQFIIENLRGEEPLVDVEGSAL